MKVVLGILIVVAFVTGLWAVTSFLSYVLGETISKAEDRQDEPLEHSVPPFDEGGMYIG